MSYGDFYHHDECGDRVIIDDAQRKHREGHVRFDHVRCQHQKFGDYV